MSVNIQELIDRITSEEDIIQKARLIYYVRKNQELRLKEIADAIGLQPSHVAHILRLLKLPPIVIDGYYSKVVSITHLFIIARLKTQEDMLEAYETVLAKSLPVQQTEDLIRKKLHGVKTSAVQLTRQEIDEFLAAIHELDENINAKVIQTRIQSKIVFELKGDTTYTTEVLRKLLKKFRGDLPTVNKKEMIHQLD